MKEIIQLRLVRVVLSIFLDLQKLVVRIAFPERERPSLPLRLVVAVIDLRIVVGIDGEFDPAEPDFSRLADERAGRCVGCRDGDKLGVLVVVVGADVNNTFPMLGIDPIDDECVGAHAAVAAIGMREARVGDADRAVVGRGGRDQLNFHIGLLDGAHFLRAIDGAALRDIDLNGVDALHDENGEERCGVQAACGHRTLWSDGDDDAATRLNGDA